MIKAVLLLLALPIAQPAAAQSLAEAVDAAYDTNPELAAARARQEALAETPSQARAGGRLVADVSGTAGYDRFGYGEGAGGTANASLPLWTGGRVTSAVRASTSDVAAGAAFFRDREAEILQSVVEAYANLLYHQQAVEIARGAIDRLDLQLAEARSRFDLGQATRTDVAQLEAQRATVIASLADSRGALEAEAANFRAIVGATPGGLQFPVTAPAGLPATVEEARLSALAENPVVRGQELVAEAASARVDQARAERAPVVEVAGAYGYGASIAAEGRGGYVTQAFGGLRLRLPILTGGLVESRVREARAIHRAERYTIEAYARGAERDALSAWASLSAARARVDASEEGREAADLALRGVQAEYGFDLRMTIDILVAEQSLRAAQLALARSRSDVLIAEAFLLRVIGRLGQLAYRSSVLRQE